MERIGTRMFLVGKPELKRPIRKPRHRLMDSIEIDLGEMMVWYGLN
jgi:hypothetical protein